MPRRPFPEPARVRPEFHSVIDRIDDREETVSLDFAFPDREECAAQVAHVGDAHHGGTRRLHSMCTEDPRARGDLAENGVRALQIVTQATVGEECEQRPRVDEIPREEVARVDIEKRNRVLAMSA